MTLNSMLYLVPALLVVHAFQHAVYAEPSGKAGTSGSNGPGVQAAGSVTKSIDKKDSNSANKADIDSTNKADIDSANKADIDSANKADIDSTNKADIDSAIDSTNKAEIDSANKADIDSTNKADIDSANKADIDSANKADTIKSWTSENPPTEQDRNFLNSLKWKEHKAGSYVIKTGIIFDKWIAAMQFTVNGKAVLTEYTPPSEYLVFVDPKTGTKSSKLLAADVNEDGALEVAFLHEKLNDANYHMYSVYSLTESVPKLVWKSGGKFGDWLTQAHSHGGTLWKGGASPD